MKTVNRTHYGPPGVLRVAEVPTPKPGAKQVLIKVHAATVNRTDCGGLRGRPFIYRFFVGFPRPRYRATGTDFAGEVVAIGSGVRGYGVGDRVWGFDDNGAGSHAQYIAFGVDKPIGKIPTGLSYSDAAASLEGAHYALNFLNKVTLSPGQPVLVNGGTGAIGSAAIQILKYRGLRVTAVCGPSHVQAVAALGADRVIDYTKIDFTAESVKYDFVFDAVGKSTFGACRPVLVPQGVYISSELGPWGQNILFALLTPLRPGRRVIFPLPVDIKKSMQVMAELIEKGRFKPLIDRTYSIDQIQDAFEYVESGQKIGNVLLAFD